jgi:hypothetical protein
MTYEERQQAVDAECKRLRDTLQCANEIGEFLNALVWWSLFAHEPGNFLCYVLANDFANAATHADSTNVQRLRAYALFLYNGLPRDAWGSRAKMNEWQGTLG